MRSSLTIGAILFFAAAFGAEGQNLVQNPNFGTESSSSPWMFDTDPGGNVLFNYQFTGHSMIFSDTINQTYGTGDARIPAQQEIYIMPGATYRFSGNINVLSACSLGPGFSSRAQARLYWRDSANTPLQLFSASAEYSAVGNYTFSLDTTAPQNAGIASIQLDAGGYSSFYGCTARFEFSNISLIQLTPSTVCVPSATTLCVNGNRFAVTATWKTVNFSGPGQAVRLNSDSGYFWFFSPTNTEVVIKVLNGCGIINSYWVFASGLTDLGVELVVTDTKTGTIKTYTNPMNAAFLPIQDTNAFHTCP